MKKEKTEKIRLIFIIDSLERGGAEKLLLSTLIFLDKEKFDYIVIYLMGKGELVPKIKKAHISIFGPLVSHEKNIVGCVLKLIKLMRAFNPDIVHTHLYYADIYGRIAAWISHVPVIISTLHNLDYSFENHSSFTFKLQKLIDRLTGKCINNHFFAVSNAVRNYFKKNLGFNNITTIYNGIDFNLSRRDGEEFSSIRKSLGLHPSDIVIVNVGRLHQGKGQFDLIKAFNLLSKTIPDLKLLIAGRGPLDSELKKFVKDHDIQDKIKFLGGVEDVDRIYKLSNIFVLPSLYEGFGLAILEAMACSIPVIATAVDGIKEIIEDKEDGILIQPRSPHQLASAIKRLIEEPDLVKKITDNARIKVQEQFDIRKKVKEAEQIYFNLIHSTI